MTTFLIVLGIVAYWIFLDVLVRRGNRVIDQREAAMLRFVREQPRLVVELIGFTEQFTVALQRAQAEVEKAGAYMREHGIEDDAEA